MPNNNSLENEPALILKFQEGDQEAFRMIFDWVYKPLFSFVLQVVKVQEDAEDIVAEQFYKLFHRRKEFDSADYIKRWLYVAARNESIDYLRRRDKDKEQADELRYLSDDAIDIELARIKEMTFQELQADIHRRVNNLPKQRGRVFRKYFFEQKDTYEIAAELSIAPQSVLNHKTQALDKLRGVRKR